MKASVCLFAYNEDCRLPRAVAALDAAAAGLDYVAFIMENGSRDQTALIARALAAADPRLAVQRNLVADKAAAWNDYVHRLAPEADLHIFLNASAEPYEGSFSSLQLALSSSSEAYAAAALPASGRKRLEEAVRLYRDRFISAPLYALSGRAISLFRERDLWLPAGLLGEDALLTYLLASDLNAGSVPLSRERIAVAAGAFYEFDKVDFLTMDAVSVFQKMKRSAMQWFQHQLLYPLLKREGVAAMPYDIRELFTRDAVAALEPRDGLLTGRIDRFVLRELAGDALP